MEKEKDSFEESFEVCMDLLGKSICEMRGDAFIKCIGLHRKLVLNGPGHPDNEELALCIILVQLSVTKH